MTAEKTHERDDHETPAGGAATPAPGPAITSVIAAIADRLAPSRTPHTERAARAAQAALADLHAARRR